MARRPTPTDCVKQELPEHSYAASGKHIVTIKLDGTLVHEERGTYRLSVNQWGETETTSLAQGFSDAKTDDAKAP